MPLNIAATRGILPRGGTILGSSRTNPFKIENGVERIKENLAKMNIDALIAIGGEDTLGVATKLDALGVKVIGVPKTIDNDLNNTDYTFGFDTSVNIAVEAIDRLHTTAESHHRALIVEVMGRHAGWIALHSGLVQRPITGTKSMKKCNQRLLEKAIPKICDQKQFAVTIEYVSSSCVGSNALKVFAFSPSS